jgi:SAM-dependent methyltransferase
MLLSNIEYIVLRLLRRFLFTDGFLLKFGNYLPYYRVNLNQVNPASIVCEYKKYLSMANIDSTAMSSILEIGVGATNSTGYEMAKQNFASSGQIVLLEPYAYFNEELDEKISLVNGYSDEVKGKIARVKQISEIPASSVDLVLSNSVLEHVDNFSELSTQLKRILKPDGAMLHIVDYRDHFFKYPYHFLQFSKNIWNRYLNPGDLPRWRIYDHLKIFNEQNLITNIVEVEKEEMAYLKIKPYVNMDFDQDNELVSVTKAVLLVTGQTKPYK